MGYGMRTSPETDLFQRSNLSPVRGGPPHRRAIRDPIGAADSQAVRAHGRHGLEPLKSERCLVAEPRIARCDLSAVGNCQLPYVP
jgi:hypothetical protein